MRLNQIWSRLWLDESGFVLSSEAVLVGTVGILGATVGLSAISQSVNDELTELAFAIRSLDQSYSFEGTKGCGAWTAGSQFIQRDVEESIEDLCAEIEEMKDREQKQADDHDAGKKKEEMKKREAQKKKEAERKKREEDRQKKEETALSA